MTEQPHADHITTVLERALQGHGNDDKPPHVAPGTIPLDGVVPRVTVRVYTTEQVAAVVGAANTEGWQLTPFGGTTHMNWGAPLSRIDVAVDMSGMNQVIAYDRDDMTITVQAGVTYVQLQRTLAAERQYVPVDPPVNEAATLGGIVAANATGPLRFAHGTWRDFVIGTQVVLANGHVTHAGGRVVKNAAGFDLCKLYTGSLGTLGVVTEMTLMVRPLPEARQAVVVPLARVETIEPVLAALLRANVEPAFVELLNEAAFGRDPTVSVAADAPYVLLVGFASSAKAVAWQIEHTLQTIASLPTPSGHELKPFELSWDEAYTTVQRARTASTGDVVLRVSILCSEMGSFIDQAEAVFTQHDIPWAMAATAGAGVIHLYVDGAAEDKIAPLINELRDVALTPPPAPSVPPLQPAGAAGRTVLPSPAATESFAGLGDLALLRELHSRSLVVESAPATLRAALPLPDSSLANKPLMQQIKQNFDPRHVLNKGRFVGG